MQMRVERGWNECESDDVGDEDTCELCPQGTYQDQEGTEKCIACAADRSTAGVGSTAPSDCVRKSMGYVLFRPFDFHYRYGIPFVFLFCFIIRGL